MTKPDTSRVRQRQKDAAQKNFEYYGGTTAGGYNQAAADAAAVKPAPAPDVPHFKLIARGLAQSAQPNKQVRTIVGGQERFLAHKRDTSGVRARQENQRNAAFRTTPDYSNSSTPPAKAPTYATGPGKWQSKAGMGWVWMQQNAQGQWVEVGAPTGGQ